MNVYTFECEGQTYTVTRSIFEEGAHFAGGDGDFGHVSAAGLEILRLAARVAELEAERDRAWERVLREREKP